MFIADGKTTGILAIMQVIAEGTHFPGQSDGSHTVTENKVPQINGTELRRIAEERLGEKPGADPRIGADPLILLHELQVHQIELEMQNAQLLHTRNEVELALEKYTDLYDFAPVGYLTLDRNGTILTVNLTGSSLIGVERSRLIGRRFGQFVSKKTRCDYTDFLEKVFTGPAKVTCEAALLKGGNPELSVQIEGVASPSGVECRIALVDISERKRAGEELQLAKEAAEVLRLANEAVEVLRLANETAKTVRLANEAAEELRLVNEASEAHRLAKEASEKLRLANEATEALILAKETAMANDAGEALRLAKDAAVALRLAKEAALELRLSKESFEATARTKNLFFANMSHELRTPMTGILGLLQLTLEEDLSPVTRGYLETTLSSARCLLQILNDILDMAKIEAGKLTIEEKPFSLQKCLTEAVDIMTPEVRRKGLDFVVSMPEEYPDTVDGDQARLRQVLLNLIGNAVKFTEVGKVHVHITVGRMTSQDTCEFTFAVSDTGIGIPNDKQKLLFHTFSQVDASHSRIYGGTGLGLAICRDIVELMGGTISLVSKEGFGSTFSFTVPLAKAEFENTTLIEAKSLSSEKIIIPVGEKIPWLLIAEDEPNTRMALATLLKMMTNFKYDFVEDGQKAVEMWVKGNYDLILMDVQMPRLDGFEATRTIREKELLRGGRTPIVAMTAHVSKEDEKRCLEAGMDIFISKPIDFASTLNVIGKIIKQKSCSVN